ASKPMLEKLPTGNATVALLTASAAPTPLNVNVEPDHVSDVPSRLAAYAYPPPSIPPPVTAVPVLTKPGTLSTAARLTLTGVVPCAKIVYVPLATALFGPPPATAIACTV